MTRFYNRSEKKSVRRKLRREMPKAERLLWNRLRGKQLRGDKFRRQYSVGPYILDFYCPRAKLAIELDGESHCSDGALVYDEKRREFIEDFGIEVLRFANVDVYDRIEGVLEMIQGKLKKRT